MAVVCEMFVHAVAFPMPHSICMPYGSRRLGLAMPIRTLTLRSASNFCYNACLAQAVLLLHTLC